MECGPALAESSGTPNWHVVSSQKGRTAMRQEPYALQWAVAEQRRQELFSEVDRMRQIRDARANGPQPVAAPSKLSCIFDSVLAGLARASHAPVQFGPGPLQRDVAGSIDSPGAGQP